jgi:hypothetical protein
VGGSDTVLDSGKGTKTLENDGDGERRVVGWRSNGRN